MKIFITYKFQYESNPRARNSFEPEPIQTRKKSETQVSRIRARICELEQHPNLWRVMK